MNLEERPMKKIKKGLSDVFCLFETKQKKDKDTIEDWPL